MHLINPDRLSTHICCFTQKMAGQLAIFIRVWGAEDVGDVVLTPSRARAERGAPRSRASPGACECAIIYIQVHELTEGAGRAEGACGAGLDVCAITGLPLCGLEGHPRVFRPLELSVRCEGEVIEKELEYIAALYWRRRGG